MSAVKLRFKGFSDKWQIGDYSSFVTNKSKKYNPSSSTEFYKCIELEHLESNTGNIIGFTKSETTNSIKNVFEKENVLFGKLRPYLNKFAFTKFKGVCSSEIWVLTSTTDKIKNKFLYYIIQAPSFLRTANISSGSKMPRADWSNFSDKLIKFPTLPEQEKIASFFTVIDEKLNLLKEKKEKLELYKKGVMQQMFSQKLRFKDEKGNEFPEWENRKIEEIFNFKQGIQCEVNLQTLDKNEDNYRFIRIIDLTSELEAPRYIVHNNVDDVLFEDDLFMVRYGIPGLIGHGYSGVIANNLFRLLPTSKLVSKFYKFQLEYLNKEILKLSSSTTMPAINFKSLNKLVVFNPVIEEQQKIANFLSALDTKISLVSTQIEKTELWKKGLLQQMFV